MALAARSGGFGALGAWLLAVEAGAGFSGFARQSIVCCGVGWVCFARKLFEAGPSKANRERKGAWRSMLMRAGRAQSGVGSSGSEATPGLLRASNVVGPANWPSGWASQTAAFFSSTCACPKARTTASFSSNQCARNPFVSVSFLLPSCRISTA